MHFLRTENKKRIEIEIEKITKNLAKSMFFLKFSF